MSVLNPYILDVKQHGGDSGSLVALESIGFDIRRVFYIFGVPAGAERGHHGHRNTSQFLTCVSGSVDIEITNSNGCFRFVLDIPSKALMMPPDNYIIMKNFSSDCILMVLADTLHSSDIVIKA
jgi:hypothetical protein